MNHALLRAIVFSVAAGVSTAASAAPPSPEVSLCQRDVMSQITLEHQHAKLDFNNKSIAVSAPSGNEVNVTGKGNFTKKDGTVKKFNYTCRVNTAEHRLVSATVTKTGEK